VIAIEEGIADSWFKLRRCGGNAMVIGDSASGQAGGPARALL